MANFTKVVVATAALLAFLQMSSAVSQLIDVPAVTTLNGFQQGESGGGPTVCDGRYLSDQKLIVSLSSQWFQGGAWCGRLISIFIPGKPLYSLARVVDECRDCDKEVGVSAIVRGSFLLDPSLPASEVTITWSDVN